MTEIRIAANAEPVRVLEHLAELDRAADVAEVRLRIDHRAGERPGVVVAAASWISWRGSNSRTTKVEIDGDTRIIDWDALGLLRPEVRLGFTGVGGPSPFETPRSLDLRVARELAERITDALERRVPGISPSVLRMARFVLEELGANVLQHSGRPDTGFGTMAFDESRRALELAFADRGVGFLESLQRNPELLGRIADDAEALQLALTPRVTGTGQSRTNMGIGLKLLVDLSDLLAGDLWVASGSAVLHRRTVAGVRANALRPMGPWRGAWICLDAPMP